MKCIQGMHIDGFCRETVQIKTQKKAILLPKYLFIVCIICTIQKHTHHYYIKKFADKM